jgi:hypothetical protein
MAYETQSTKLSRQRGRRALLLATLAALCMAGAVGLHPVLDAAGFIGTSKTYTTDADFDLGVLFNVNHDAPGNNQLQLNAQRTTFPVMWITNAGEDTVSKIDTTNGRELARYRTGFGPAGQAGYLSHLNNAYAGPAPSRTAVDSDGNVYVANRHFDNKPASVMKILASGGIDRNGNGTIETSSDVNNDGVIAGAEILNLGDTNLNGAVDAAELQDERVAWIVQVGPNAGLGRSLCRDANGFIWLGLYNARQYYKLDPADGTVLAGPVSTASPLSNNPYGCLVDNNGQLWGASLSSTLLQLNTNTNSIVNVYNHSAFGSDYGIGIGNGRVYQAGNGYSYIEFNPSTNTFSAPAALRRSSIGVVTDGSGNIIVGLGGSGVTKYAPNGAVIWSAPNQGGTPNYCYGVQIDSDQNVWCIHFGTFGAVGKIAKYDGTTGAALGVFSVGNNPYTYSDATGIAAFSTTNPLGRWSIVQDAGTAGTQWSTVRWNQEAQGSVPAGTSIGVEGRASDTEAALGGLAWVPIGNGAPLTLTGRFIEVRATLQSNNPLLSPILSDLSINSVPRVTSCDADRDGDVDSADLLLIRNANGQTATAGDPRDGNGDGVINVADGRYCALRCTRAGCAQ